MENNTLNIMATVSLSSVNGPGERLVIWTQGCGKACKGCFNPESWSRADNVLADPIQLAATVRQLKPAGLTLTGGDPLEQPFALLEFLTAIHEHDGTLGILPRGVILFTGYTWSEIFSDNTIGGAAMRSCVAFCDVVIDGRYDETLRIDDRLAGSSNQQFHFLPFPGRGRERVAEEEIFTDQGVEIHSDPHREGVVQVTGFPSMSASSRKILREMGVRLVAGV